MTSDTIFLVEDNAADEALTLRALKRNKIGNEVVVARDGAEALAQLLGAKPLPRVVLLDLKLPKVNGHEVLTRVRGNARTKLLPVVVLTSSAEEEDVAAAYARGANSYIRKPVDYTAFVEAIGQLSQYWLSLNHPPPSPRAA